MKAWTYITTNKANKVLYTGVTSNLKNRVESHRTKKYLNSFTARYNADKLVWFQEFDSIIDANARERQLKAGNRTRKLKLIEEKNPECLPDCVIQAGKRLVRNIVRCRGMRPLRIRRLADRGNLHKMRLE